MPKGTPEQIKAQKARRKARLKESGRSLDAGNIPAQRYRKSVKVHGSDTFIGCDGEGWDDEQGHHQYMMLIAGSNVLYTGRPLTSEECLGFIADRPMKKGQYYVAFFFDYDVTMILKDIAREDPDVAKKIAERAGTYGKVTWWRGFGISYTPKKRLTVQRRGETQVTIHDTRSFFQCAFVKALDTFHVGTPEQRDEIRNMKALRSGFTQGMAREVKDYSISECALLAQLVDNLSSKFSNAGLSAHPYEGPGPVAGRLLTRHFGTRKKRRDQSIPKPVSELAVKSYYGGWFETTAVGTVTKRVYGYDIKSAYPAAMQELPCLIHGEWISGIHSDLWIGQIEWDMGSPIPGQLCPFPVRTKAGNIFRPTRGKGWYWSVECPTMDYEKFVVNKNEAWSYIKWCECKPFEWVEELYYRRLEMEREEKGSGIGLKLTINSIYGKLAQQVGAATHYNPVQASLITAIVRGRIYRLYELHPLKVVMVATDAVYVIEPCPELTIGEGLGQWEPQGPYDDFCIFQPGVYFDGGEAKFATRGIPRREFEARVEEFRQCANSVIGGIELQQTNHLGFRKGMALGGDWIDRIGDWIPQPRRMTPDPSPKRDLNTYGITVVDGTKMTSPYGGWYETVPYDRNASVDRREQQYWEDGLHDG